MRHASTDSLALRRDALQARAALQRMEISAALEHLHHGVTSMSGAGAIAVRLARWVAGRAISRPAGGAGASPWMLSAGWLLASALRRHPTVRWLMAAGAAGAAIWWVVRALKTTDAAKDESGPGAAGY